MKILIIGATGSIGREVTQQLLVQAKHHITLLARHLPQDVSSNQQTTWVQGDVTQLATLQAMIAKQDAVIIAVSGQIPAIVQTVITAMQATKVTRLILVTSMGIYNEIPAKIGVTGNLEFNPVLRPYRQAADLVTDSGLQYTIIRPGWFDNGNHHYEVTRKGQAFGGQSVSRWAVADLIQRSVQDKRLIYQDLGINRPDEGGH